MRELSFESTQTVTADEFVAYVDARPATDDGRYELLGGRVVLTSPAGPPHGAASARIVLVLGGFAIRRALGLCFESSQGFELPSGDHVAPDFSFVSNERWDTLSGVRAPFLKVVPDLVVEVLSSATASRDRELKKHIYERNGVREYWLVDPRAREVTVHHLAGDRFDPGDVHRAEQRVSSSVLEDLAVPVSSLVG